MAKARTPNPSRIGKTLGAILSVPRRSAADDSEEVDASEPASPDVPSAPDATAAPDGDTDPPRASAPLGTPAENAPAEPLPADPAPPATAAGPSPATTPVPTPTSVTPQDGAPRLSIDEDAVDADAGGGARRKKRETFLIPEELADAMRNAIVHLSGPPLYYTLAEFGEHAIRSYIAQLEREHNSGQPFPRRPRAVRQGRPLR